MVEEIVKMYYEAVGIRNPLPGFRKKSIEVINQLLNNGVEQSKIIKAVEYYVSCYESYGDRPAINMGVIFAIEDIRAILRIESEVEDNLIDKARFYFHKRLRRMSKPPKLTIDEDGVHVVETEPFFLEMENVFTPKDLLEYFYEVHQVDELCRKENRDIAGVKYIVEQYRDSNIKVNWLDLILYMVDVSRRIIIEDDKRPMINILHIQDYEQDALELLEDKMNYERVNGVDRIVPRTKVDSRNGWTK